jgi:hypothetical protein
MAMALLALACPGCAASRQAHEQTGESQTRPSADVIVPVLYDAAPEEYRVYAALLEQLYVQNKDTALTGDGNRIGGRGPVIDQIVLADRTMDLRLFPDLPDTANDQEIIDDGTMDAPRQLKGCTAELLRSFSAANRKPARLIAKDVKVFGLEVIPIALDEFSYGRMPPVPSGSLYQRYPRCQGITILSRVGFPESGDTAVVLMGTMRAHLFGYGDVFLLKKKDAQWRIVEWACTWRS